MVFKAVEETFRNITPPLLVGVSGGPDSLALLHVAAGLNLSPFAVYFNHMLREDTPQEEVFVRDFAQSLGVPFRKGAGNVRLYADEQGLSIEEAARILRYKFLFQTAADISAGAVVVAHHADDQVETILMNLLRGTGMRGMLGMQVVSLPNQWSDSIPLVRPFLGIEKNHILDYVNEHKLNPLIDPTNAELIYQRNRIRHELIPLLEKLTPGFRQRLLQTAEILSKDEQVLEKMTEITWKSCLEDQSDHQLQLNREVLREISPSIQRRLIR
ncbi:MAG: tRNA lysidine(34) synthetase TilS, partial [Anaerolineales bacterium]|nr:tRNA lysidine(34) synthetase TilS [Anaerolineales bacterium]